MPMHPFANAIEDDSFDSFVPSGGNFQKETVTPGESERIHAE